MKKLKIAVVLESNFDDGGGFNQSVSAVTAFASLCKDRFELCGFTNSRESIKSFEAMNIEVKYFSYGLSDKMIRLFSSSYLFRVLQSKLKIVGAFEKLLINQNIDLVYFVTQGMGSLHLQKLNYISTVWDICHRDTPEFPEVRTFNEFLNREFYLSHSLTQAVAVLVDSEKSVESINSKYGVLRDRLINIPFSPSPFFKLKNDDKKATLKFFKLEEGYLFYPAQLWPHKNHVRILQALALLRERKLNMSIVFCGGDKGNKSNLFNVADKLGVSDQVEFLGFVEANWMRGLYEGCSAVVMPTYFGPTNLPPYEAWSVKKPLIYSSHLASQVGDAAILADPDCAVSLSRAVQSLSDKELVARVIKNGTQRLTKLKIMEKQAYKELHHILSKFEKRLQCWGY